MTGFAPPSTIKSSQQTLDLPGCIWNKGSLSQNIEAIDLLWKILSTHVCINSNRLYRTILVRRPSFNTGFVVVFPWPPTANGHSHDCWPKLPESPFIFSGERTCFMFANQHSGKQPSISLRQIYAVPLRVYPMCLTCGKYLDLDGFNHQRQPLPINACARCRQTLAPALMAWHVIDSHRCTKSSSNLKTNRFSLAFDFCWSVQLLFRKEIWQCFLKVCVPKQSLSPTSGEK